MNIKGLHYLQADAYAQSQGMVLVGYYHANERIDDLELGPAARKIADRIHANSPQSCALLVCRSCLHAQSFVLWEHIAEHDCIYFVSSILLKLYIHKTWILPKLWCAGEPIFASASITTIGLFSFVPKNGKEVDVQTAVQAWARLLCITPLKLMIDEVRGKISSRECYLSLLCYVVCLWNTASYWLIFAMFAGG